MAEIILASASPRRRELLEQITVRYRVQAVDIDESALPNEPAKDLAQRLALAKARSVWASSDQQCPVLGADTLGVLDDKLLVKPRDYAHACEMWTLMAERYHTIYSAVALCSEQGEAVCLSVNHVFFTALSDKEKHAYWATAEPCDKAGAYAIQGLGAMFVKSLQGSYSAVMGLPLYETTMLLKKLNINLLHRTA